MVLAIYVWVNKAFNERSFYMIFLLQGSRYLEKGIFWPKEENQQFL